MVGVCVSQHSHWWSVPGTVLLYPTYPKNQHVVFSWQNHERVQDPPRRERVAQPAAGPGRRWGRGLHRLTAEAQDSLRHYDSLGSQCQGRSLDQQDANNEITKVLDGQALVFMRHSALH